jgi:hypothetical protein
MGVTKKNKNILNNVEIVLMLKQLDNGTILLANPKHLVLSKSSISISLTTKKLEGLSSSAYPRITQSVPYGKCFNAVLVNVAIFGLRAWGICQKIKYLPSYSTIREADHTLMTKNKFPSVKLKAKSISMLIGTMQMSTMLLSAD